MKKRARDASATSAFAPHVALGDAHNFGRRVSRRAGWIAKPRPLLWEWLLLSAKSPLRRALDQAADAAGLGKEAFAFLPRLAFSDEKKLHGGEVEAVALQPLPRSRAVREALASIVGRAIALFSWLGIADLHWENLVVGRDATGNVVFAPLDVEMIFADMELPTETKLLPDADPEVEAICRHAAGVRRALPWLGKPVDVSLLLEMASAYRATLSFLDRHAAVVTRAFESVRGLRETPIRVCLRGTGDYVAPPPEGLWPPLLDAEVEQLARGDVPYFFRLYGRAGIHYWGDHALRQRKTIPMRGDVPHLEKLLRFSQNLRSQTRRTLREEGLFALIGAFDHPALTGRHTHGSLDVTFGPRTIVVRFPDGDELRARRNLRAFVASVYLPCRCGEVRSVFVPPVTKCRASAR